MWRYFMYEFITDVLYEVHDAPSFYSLLLM